MSRFEEDREEPTLRRIARDAARLVAMAEDAERQGIEVGRVLGRGGYGVVFRAVTSREGPCALKIPCRPHLGVDEHPDVVPHAHGPNQVRLVGPTGPFELRAPDGLEEAAGLLEGAARTQISRGAGRPLARVHRLIEIGGLPAVLMERVSGPTFRGLIQSAPERAARELTRIRDALVLLDDVFGPHGDLKPEHVICRPEGTVFIDPLTADAPWIGSIGYALPPAGGAWALRNESEVGRLEWRALRDVAALAAMTAETLGGSLKWDGRTAYCIANIGNGRFSQGITSEGVLESMRGGTERVPEPWRGWVRAVGDDYVRAFLEGEGPALGADWPASSLASFPVAHGE